MVTRYLRRFYFLLREWFIQSFAIQLVEGKYGNFWNLRNKMGGVIDRNGKNVFIFLILIGMLLG